MATLKQQRTQAKRSAKSGPKAPLSSHPAFAAIVALWFAALLGIGSLILPVALIEKVVVALGLPSLISATAPPLGFTARAAIALAATVAGAVLGLFAARQVARSSTPKSATRSVNPADLIRRQPVNAHAELGADGFDGTGTARRRSLALADGDDQASDLLPAWAQPAAARLAVSESESEDTPDFELGDDMMIADDEPLSTLIAEPAPEPIPGPEDDLAEEAYEPLVEFTEQEDFSAQGEPELRDDEDDELVAEKHLFQPFATQAEADEIEGGEDLPESLATLAEPLPFSAPSRHAGEVEAARLAGPADPAVDAGNAEAQASDLADLGLVQLVQRLEATIEKRRALAAEREAQARAAAEQAAQAAPAPIKLELASAFGAIEADEAELARNAYFGGAAPKPEPVEAESVEPEAIAAAAAAKQPEEALPPLTSFADFGDDDDDADDLDALAASFALPIAKPAKAPDAPEPKQVFMPVPAPAPEAPFAKPAPSLGREDDALGAAIYDDSETDDGADDDYSSLASLRNDAPAARLMRIEEPETEIDQSAVVFPGQSPSAGARSFDPPAVDEAKPASVAPSLAHTRATGPSGEEADRALREALRNLQRMGKAS